MDKVMVRCIDDINLCGVLYFLDFSVFSACP